MANVKITDLTAASVPLAGTELFETVQGGSSKKVAASDIGNSADALPFTSVAGRSYGMVYSTQDQTGNVSTPTPVTFNTTAFSEGVSIVSNSRFTTATAGVYMFTTNLQFANSASTNYTVAIWFRKNGVDVADSVTRITVPKLADGGAAFFSLSFFEQMDVDDYMEVIWLPTNVAVTIDYDPAMVGPPVVPASGSALFIADRIA